MCTGAFFAFAAWSARRGAPDLGFQQSGWLWIILIALVSAVAAIVLFLFGFGRVGPTTASLLSTVEPVVTVTGAALVFGGTLSHPQVLGGLLVLLTVLFVQWPERARVPNAMAP